MSKKPKTRKKKVKPPTARTLEVAAMKATKANLKTLDWGAGCRDAVCNTAFVHGQDAQKEAAGGKLTWAMIKKTFDVIKVRCPPRKGGGGLVCVE